MHVEKLLIWRIKSKICFCPNFLLLYLDSWKTDLFFYYPSAQGNGILILYKRRDLLQISRARPRNQGCESVTWKLDFVTWDATLDIFFSLIDPATAEKFIYCNQYYFTFASVKNYSLWSIAIRQMDRNGSINGDETQDLYLPLFQKTKNIHTRETANGIILNLQPCREDLECALEKNCKYHNQEAAISLCNTGEL